MLPRPPQCDVRLPIWRTLGWRTPDLPQPAACRSICSCVSCCADDAPALLSLLAGSYPITSTLTRAATPLAFTTLHPIVIPHRTALPRPLELIPQLCANRRHAIAISPHAMAKKARQRISYGESPAPRLAVSCRRSAVVTGRRCLLIAVFVASPAPLS